MSNEKTYILWFGTYEWEEFEGTPQEALAYMHREYRFANYGHRGGIVITGTVVEGVNENGEYHSNASASDWVGICT